MFDETLRTGLREFPGKAIFLLFAAGAYSKQYCLRIRHWQRRVVLRVQIIKNEPGNYLKP